MLQRRQALLGIPSLLAAPAIARAASLMPVSPIVHPEWIKDAMFSYRGDTVRAASVVFEDGMLCEYRSTRVMRRLLRQIDQQLEGGMTRGRPVRICFYRSPVGGPVGATTYQMPELGSVISSRHLAVIPDPKFGYLLEESSPSKLAGQVATAQYDCVSSWKSRELEIAQALL